MKRAFEVKEKNIFPCFTKVLSFRHAKRTDKNVANTTVENGAGL